MEGRANQLPTEALSLEEMVHEIILDMAVLLEEPLLQSMPHEILQMIAGFLDFKSALALSSVCRSTNAALDLKFFKALPDQFNEKVFVSEIIALSQSALGITNRNIFPGKSLAPKSFWQKIATISEEVLDTTGGLLEGISAAQIQMHPTGSFISYAPEKQFTHRERHRVRESNDQYFVNYDQDYHYIACLKIILNLNISNEMKLIAIHTTILNSPKFSALLEEHSPKLPFKNIVRYFNKMDDQLALIEGLQTKIKEMYDHYKATNYRSDSSSTQQWLNIFKELEQLQNQGKEMRP